MWEGKGLMAPLSHPLPFVIVVSLGQLGLTLPINSKGLVQRTNVGCAGERKAALEIARRLHLK